MSLSKYEVSTHMKMQNSKWKKKCWKLCDLPFLDLWENPIMMYLVAKHIRSNLYESTNWYGKYYTLSVLV
jgi:hypothetical protein